MKPFFAVFALAAGVFQLAAQEKVGPQPDGSVLLRTGWKIKPAGTLVPVDTSPMAALTTPDQKYLLVLNGGVNPPSISVIDIAAAKELSRTPVADAWLGFTMTRTGDKVCVGSGRERPSSNSHWRTESSRPGGLFLWSLKKIASLRISSAMSNSLRMGGCSTLPICSMIQLAVINPQSGIVLSRFKTGRRPYRILFHPSGKSLYVTSWADGSCRSV